MKKVLHSTRLAENAQVIFIAAGFLALVFALSYLYWFA
jgi:hypothetical protein